ncbi:MAG TPA: hypothetical protein DCF33_05190, partial [Saprospirales bacterium]|nr:hypothetical protein [Saprospirales bacterium]
MICIRVEDPCEFVFGETKVKKNKTGMSKSLISLLLRITSAQCLCVFPYFCPKIDLILSMSPSKTYLILLFFLIAGGVTLIAQKSASANNYLTSVARSGEDALDMLDRFELAEHDCNVAHFLKINQLDNYKLRVGSTYKLPVMVVS